MTKMHNTSPKTLTSLWDEAWALMHKWGMPLNEAQQQRIKNFQFPLDYEEPSQFSMAYFITEHFENLKWPDMPQEIKGLIHVYKIHMMNMWHWPEWGYADVKHEKMPKR